MATPQIQASSPHHQTTDAGKYVGSQLALWLQTCGMCKDFKSIPEILGRYNRFFASARILRGSVMYELPNHELLLVSRKQAAVRMNQGLDKSEQMIYPISCEVNVR
jgi:hypothetical protein